MTERWGDRNPSSAGQLLRYRNGRPITSGVQCSLAVRPHGRRPPDRRRGCLVVVRAAPDTSVGDTVHFMGEFVSLLAALVSAAAAAVGATVSLAQYRQSRSAPAVAPPLQTVPSVTPVPQARPSVTTRPAPPLPGSPNPPPDRSSRTIRRAIVAATVCCFATAVSQLSYWVQQTTEHSAALEALTSVTAVLSGVLSMVGVMYAFRVAVGGLVRHRWRQMYVAGWVLLGSMTPWIGLWIQVLINRNLRGIGG
jgi:hypothetical protein